MGETRKRKPKRKEKNISKKAKLDKSDLVTENNGNEKDSSAAPQANTVNNKTSGEIKPYQPVLGIKKPSDYSANWKQLKDIITKGDKPRQKKEPETKNKGLHITKKERQTKSNTKKRKAEEEEDIWFDNVDPSLIESSKNSGDKGNKTKLKKAGTSLVDTNASEDLTDVVAMDCEMVGVGFKAKESMLARVSIVNQHGYPVYDKFVLPMEKVEDYRTFVSGVRPEDFENAEKFFTVQREVYDIIKDRTLVGHSLKNDFRALYLTQPRHQVRDTSLYREFRKMFGGRTPGLKKLTEKVLGVSIQEGEHSSVQDAQAAMRLYMTRKDEWESMLKKSKRKKVAARYKKQAAINKGKTTKKNKTVE